MNAKVDDFIKNEIKWQQEFEKLRSIILEFDLTEDLKWGVPCYTFKQNNVILIHGFKQYCAVLFFKGALLKDRHGALVRQTANVQASRQLRFTDVSEIAAQESAIKEYISEAIEIEKTGFKVEFNMVAELDYPAEFQNKLNENPDLKTAFDALTPGRKRAYILHFSEAKQSKTREARVEKNIQRILAGKGLND